MTTLELYWKRLAERNAEAGALREREKRVSIARLVAVAAAIAIAFWNVLAALVPAAIFVVLVVVHERIFRRRRRAEAGARFYEVGVARIEDRWQGLGDPGSDLTEEHHPFAGDLDLFGRGSLFELLSLAVTRAGRARLAEWLKRPSLDSGEILDRQLAVAELRENVALREELSIDASEVTREVEGARLEEWAAVPPMTLTRTEQLLAWLLPGATIVLFLLALPAMIGRVVGWTHPEAALRFGALAGFPVWPLLVAITATVFLARRLGPRSETVAAGVERAEPALALLGGILARLEREAFTSPRLAALHDRLRGSDSPASVEIERLRRLVALLEARRNQFFAPVAVLLLWTPHLAVAIERWRSRSGSHIGEWIESVGEIEALSSLASFALEHPHFAVPDISADGPHFDATALGHPLIPGDRRITNDVRLDGTLRMLVVSGSNMSGKSTMMRSVGIAAVLAMAGAPVCARSLRMAPTAVGASISVHDSLQENASRFYAEILRIRQVIELSRRGPLLFLLDEVLAGTNSHDRRIGAEAIVRGLVERGSIGLVSTHDLALAEIANAMAPHAANVHFEDRIEEGRVVFDYRMRPGVVTRSNALELMRSVGIEV